ncbi:MAG: dTMP kinase [Rhodospirillales bacterium]|nr:dTMP kinase [Rhodospirillales bacterium]
MGQAPNGGNRGRFISFEGGEGSGKSTQIRLLAEKLNGQGIEAILTREPGGSPGAEQIRALLVSGETGRWDAMTEALLHTAARRSHLAATVWPALGQGRWVISDRYADSTLAYQGHGHGLPVEDIRRLHRLANENFWPDLTLILDVPVELGLERAGRRGGAEDRYERMGRDFHERLRQGFRTIAEAEPARCALIDSSGDIETTAWAIWKVASIRLGLAK